MHGLAIYHRKLYYQPNNLHLIFRDLVDQKDKKENVGLLEEMVDLEVKETQDHKDHQDQMDLLEARERKEKLGQKEDEELVDHLDLLVYLAMMDYLVVLEHLVVLGLKDLEVPRETRVHKVLVVLLEQRVLR